VMAGRCERLDDGGAETAPAAGDEHASRALRWRHQAGSCVITSDTFWPPKPNELEMTLRTRASRAVFGPTARGEVVPGDGEGVSVVVGEGVGGGVGGGWGVRGVTPARTARAADRLCPIIDLWEEIGPFLTRSPSTADKHMHSILSFSGVPVPWALM